MKKVKLIVNVKELFEACNAIIAPDSKVVLEHKGYLETINILKNIFSSGGLKIESVKYPWFSLFKFNLFSTESKRYTDREKEAILDIIKNNIYEYYTYNVYKSIGYLHEALKCKDETAIKSQFIDLINDIIRQTPLIYNPEQGVHMQFDRDKALEDVLLPDRDIDLSTREYILEIDDTKFLNLESLRDSVIESRDRKMFHYITKNSIEDSMRKLDMDIFKKYSFKKKYYTLDELYTKKYENTNELLIDYGLKLIHEKYHKIAELIELVREIKIISNNPQDIVEEIYKVFTAEELLLAISIKNNLKKISHEKYIHDYIIDTIEYVANKTDFLKETEGGPNILRLKAGLSNFYRKYVARGIDLKEILKKEKTKIYNEIKEKQEILREKKIEYDQAVEKNNEESVTKLSCSINNLENDLYLLRHDKHRAFLKLLNFNIKLYELDKLKPIQEEHILKGIKRFAKARKIEVDRLKVPKESEVVLEESEELKERKIIQMQKTVILIVFLISLIISIVFISFSRNVAKLSNI
ncbi:hypothetical protein NEMIN01_2342 [Nematocida minor]|uniref:uncharacterized protein n=1 Tax=Nematocida minor TaxID=1912983 RepID=UPI00221FDCAF|nr:uncharacterized protein NEMIN01_2342 [Nematocida minor]KAI5192998.1 hypothetical protein NEMIN01_2342 [Nematocida minor]